VRSLVLLDTNLLVLLVVGLASPAYIASHRRLRDDFSVSDYETLVHAISGFEAIMLVPHVLAETSNLARQIADPARRLIQERFRRLVLSVGEIQVPSEVGLRREEFVRLGLNDAVLLHLCAQSLDGLRPTLLTIDRPLADAANARGYDVVDFREFMAS
jgi:hypothetical protein